MKRSTIKEIYYVTSAKIIRKATTQITGLSRSRDIHVVYSTMEFPPIVTEGTPPRCVDTSTSLPLSVGEPRKTVISGVKGLSRASFSN